MDKAVAYFKFLYPLSSVDIDTLEPDKRDCSFCLEPYDTAPWGHVEIVNQPVKLDCGHTFGIQCLTEWAFSPNFNNFCPYCRVPLITNAHLSFDQSSQRIKRILQLRQPFDVPFQSQQEAESFKKLMAETCGETDWINTPEDQDRMMIIFEEYLKTGDPAELAPLTWRELGWWSPETNTFTSVVIEVVLLLLCLTVVVAIWTLLLYPLAKGLAGSQIVSGFLPNRAGVKKLISRALNEVMKELAVLLMKTAVNYLELIGNLLMTTTAAVLLAALILLRIAVTF